jgi:heme-degrading monooxygenase HmoA
MYARIARYDVPPDRIDTAINGFREAGEALQQLEGVVGGYLLVDEESGRTLTIVLWDNHADMAATATRAASLRQRALREADGAVVSVEEYQIALEFGGHTRDVRE